MTLGILTSVGVGVGGIVWSSSSGESSLEELELFGDFLLFLPFLSCLPFLPFFLEALPFLLWIGGLQKEGLLSEMEHAVAEIQSKRELTRA